MKDHQPYPYVTTYCLNAARFTKYKDGIANQEFIQLLSDDMKHDEDMFLLNATQLHFIYINIYDNQSYQTHVRPLKCIGELIIKPFMNAI